MKLRNLLIGSAVTGGILLCAGGIGGYQYVSKLNKQLDINVLPHTTFEGTSLDGKSKKDVQEIIQQKIDESNKKSLNYTFQGNTQAYTWKDLGVEYKETEIVEKIFKEQKGNVINRYKMRKQAENGELKREYKLTPQLNTTTYEAFIKEKYNETLEEPVNAELSVSGTTVNISQSQNGEKVDKDKLKELTAKAITAGTEDMQNMGITQVIAEYSTPMAGRNGSQSFNVNKSANTLSGAIVAPDETFSFNERVGITDAAHGYKSAAVFLQGKVVQSAGGGVCQVSSTLYGAALRADLGVVARSNHSMPVHYLPLGQDAAVADYGPDLKFKNNTGKYIYIQAFSNGSSITTRIFGTPTGKNVEVSSKVIGETENKITAVTYKKVTQNGQVISNGQISKSVYKKA
ncbi:VanW family protein [Bacillus pseudomycoides]|uniref:VanW family protein n=1 Tax=Bacillus pseudomycoides TaxID=64104 RepID=UPI003D253C3E